MEDVLRDVMSINMETQCQKHVNPVTKLVVLVQDHHQLNVSHVMKVSFLMVRHVNKDVWWENIST